MNDADKRIRILKTEAGRDKNEPVVYNNLGRVNGTKQQPLKSNETPVVETTKKERIIKLHNNGFTTSVIASRVGSTVGEIELIISLIEGR